ncbi:AzlD domain-containing protein [Acetivibrio mesophilus]|uniref:AzlD domain-containing protein n=1 Tax=Acetivibrio mesophilus TaxID=2487273 RepID=A0A4Q0I8F2_9FIRM|nr:AzlD domain-containing protein [Acetivibrio mesophilus]ODM26204.1 branched-chain amino acid transporter [Clostridium sp. Bc-iso-3]RXE60744.1 AzlD domain-containing protein [Acetivibrio mesophilus]HHV28159.1 AzlD domain-containing protein [Clostridium sp.]
MLYAFIATVLMALVTYLPRVLPIAVFRKEIKSTYIRSFLQYVPYAVLGALTFPDIFNSTSSYTTAVCGTIVALILAYREKSLFVVALGAILTVYVTGLFL